MASGWDEIARWNVRIVKAKDGVCPECDEPYDDHSDLHMEYCVWSGPREDFPFEDLRQEYEQGRRRG